MPSDLSTDYQAVYDAWQAFRQGKKPSRAIDEFAYNLERNLAVLMQDLTDKTYRHGGYQKVVLQEKKRRDLAVAEVRNRIAHRLLYDYLVDVCDKTFDPDVWSCRVGKGLHRCIARTQQLLRRHPHSYIWRADITKFFDSVNHQRMMTCLTRKLGTDNPATWLCGEIIKSYHLNNVGIPIGNLTSQIFANIYLHEFDRFVRHDLKPQAYLRYGDDFLLFLPTRRQAHIANKRAGEYLVNNLNVTINPKNTVVVSAQSGLKFLGQEVSSHFAVVDKHTAARVLDRIEPRNASSCRALPLPDTAKKQLDWILLDKYVDV